MRELWKKVRREVLMAGLFFLPEDKKRRLERRLRGRDEFQRLEGADCVVVSYGKSGRTWLRVMLSRFYHLNFGLTGKQQLLSFDNLHRRDSRIPRIFFTHDNYLTDYTGNGGTKRDYYGKKVVLLVRKPQDVAVSQFFQWKHRMRAAKKRLNEYPEDMEMPVFEFVMNSKWGLTGAIDYMNLWAEESPRIAGLLIVRYEDMRADPHATFRRIAEFIGGPVREEAVQGAVEYGSVENMRKLETGSAFRVGRMKPGEKGNPDSYKVRRAKVGGYRDYFDEEQVAAIDGAVKARLAPVYAYGDGADA